MATLYPANAGGNDQNALALHFFEAGYYAWRLCALAASGNRQRLDASETTSLREHLRQLTAYATVTTSPARVAADALSAAFEICCQSASQTRTFAAADLKSMIQAGRSATNVNVTGDIDPARAWFIAGVMAASCDLDDQGEAGPLRETDEHLIRVLGTILGREQAGLYVQKARAQGAAMQANLTGWLRANTAVLWKPARRSGELHRFNGRVLSETEYTLMEIARRRAFQNEGLSTEQLRELVAPSAPNVLKDLRTYAETRSFLSPSGKVIFVGDAPEPPSR